MQSAHPQVCFPIAEGQFDMHALAVEGDNFVGGQWFLRVGGKKKPRFLKMAIMEDDDVHGLFQRVLP